MSRNSRAVMLVWFFAWGSLNGSIADPPPTESPILGARLLANQQLQLTWAPAALGFLLEETSLLSGSPVWRAVAQSPVLEPTQFSVTVLLLL
jgi:hypothetical protein